MDTQAESHDKPIHSVEIADDFITLFCKDSVERFWNRGAQHNANRYHCEVEQNLWIGQQFPGKIREGWSQHIHLLIDGPRLADFEDYWQDMSDDLAEAIRTSFAE